MRTLLLLLLTIPIISAKHAICPYGSVTCSTGPVMFCNEQQKRVSVQDMVKDISQIVVVSVGLDDVGGYLPYLPPGMHVIVHGNNSINAALLVNRLFDIKISYRDLSAVPRGYPLDPDLRSNEAPWLYAMIGTDSNIHGREMRIIRNDGTMNIETCSATDNVGDVKMKQGFAKAPYLSITRHIGGQGYHRMAETRISSSKCEVAVVERLPPTTYFDNYELQERTRLSDDITTQSWVDHDVEGSSLAVRAFSSLLVGFGQVVSLPFHLRYQPPSNDHTTHADITISPPFVFQRCDKAWIMVNTKLESDVVQVPIGDSTKLSFVSAVTLLITMVGVAMMIFNVYRIH